MALPPSINLGAAATKHDEYNRPGAPAALVLSGVAASAAGDYRGSIPLFEEAASILRTSWAVAHWGYAAARLGDTS